MNFTCFKQSNTGVYNIWDQYISRVYVGGSLISLSELIDAVRLLWAIPGRPAYLLISAKFGNEFVLAITCRIFSY